VLRVPDPVQQGVRLAAKRALDRTVAAAALIVTAPVLAFTAIAIRATMGTPVFFSQRRPGYRARPFTIHKFRTMRNGIGADTERVTILGKWLRVTSIDELPQLWNVLRGDLSLVGPRPLLEEYLPRYTAEQARRHDVLPGITGWSAVNVRNGAPWPVKLAHDVWYVDHWSLGLDLKILALTMVSVLQRRGISQEGHATMPIFQG
jgi:lipopolysaccharide/colanic/teichoic acid biosynthesis glycosyltransferase